MNDASLVAGEGQPTIRLERVLADPPSVVWQALVEPEQLARWFPCKVVVRGGAWAVGTALEFPFPPQVIDMTLAGEVLAYEPPHVLSYTWGDDTLRFELYEEGDGTRLVLFNTLTADGAARNAAGWDECLDRLEGNAVLDGSWQRGFEAYAERFSSTLGAQSGPPAGHRVE